MIHTYIPLHHAIEITSIISAFHAHFPAEFRFDGEEHDDWEFVYVESGQIMAHADNKEYILKKGEMVCHKPFEFHTIRPYHGAADVITFSFRCSSEAMQFFNNKILFVNQRQRQYLHDLVSAAAVLLLPKDPLQISRDGGMERNPQADTVAEQYLKNTVELLVLSLLSANSTERRKRMESYSTYLQRKNLSRDIKTYLETNLSQKILLSDISEQFSYSESSIKRIFHDEVGCSILHYLSTLRITRAKELLQQGHSVTAVAQETGFDTINYFSTVFKKKTGITPTEFIADMRR